MWPLFPLVRGLQVQYRMACAHGTTRGMLTPLARLRVDHLVYGVTGSLAAAMTAFQLRTGVAPVRGGRHEGLGTHLSLIHI